MSRAVRTRPRGRLSAAAALLAALAIVTQVGSVSAGGIVWGWLVARIGSGYQDYQPLDNDERQSNTEGSRVLLVSKGHYTARFTNIGVDPFTGGYGGVVHVSPLNKSARACTVGGWFRNVDDEDFTVWCFDAAGNRKNTPFVANYASTGCCSGAVAYLYADQPLDASYNPATGWSHNSTGGTNSVVRNAKGRYTVTMPGLGGANGNVQVTAVDSTLASCNVTGWGTVSPSQVAHVACRDATGHYSDQIFNLTFVNGVGLHTYSTGSAAYIWADQPTSASYKPSAAYNFDSAGGSHHVKVTRSSTGVYVAHLNGIGGGGGSAQVTAYGPTKVRCQVGAIPVSGTTQTIEVRCFNFAGGPADARYSLLFTR